MSLNCYLFEVFDRLGYLLIPRVLTVGTALFAVQVAVHDGLQDGSEGSDSDSGGDQHRVFGVENVTGWCSVWSVNDHLNQQLFMELVHLTYTNSTYVR